MKIEKIFDEIKKLYDLSLSKSNFKQKRRDLKSEIELKIKKTKKSIKNEDSKKQKEKLQKKLEILKKLKKKVK
tara:strand:- start:10 stop:228 length:219 start_codon:yes stop_codon:yes gene_type:complete